MKITLLALFALVPALWVFGHPSAEDAVRCAVPTFENEFENSEAVFIGTVIEIEDSGDEKVVRFRVERSWKGPGYRDIKVSVYENPKFQSPFREGGRFLVFAKADEEIEGKLFDGRCSRTTDLDRNPERAEEDLERLGPGNTCEGEGEKCS